MSEVHCKSEISKHSACVQLSLAVSCL